jgi:phosphatidylserine/phosphatidylglycerophosphate/cardiolipin synthase-like enzyme
VHLARIQREGEASGGVTELAHDVRRRLARSEQQRGERRSQAVRGEAVWQLYEAVADQLASLSEQLAQSQQRQQELESQLANISVRQVPVYDHRKYLDRALEEAQQHVLIVSPWIRFEVVDDELVGRFRELLQRGVELWIAFGINKEGSHGRGKAKDEHDRDAERKLRRLGEDFPELFHMTRLGDTHAKILICDSRFSIATSYNWLSFKGDEQLEFRDERGYYVGLSSHVDELFEEYRQRFEPTAAKPTP